jgi:hypothetical protein
MSWIEKVQRISGFNDQLTGGLIGLLIFFPVFSIGIYCGYYKDIPIVLVEALAESSDKSSAISFIALLASCIVIACQIVGILYLSHILKDVPVLMKIIPERASIESSDKSFIIQSSQKDGEPAGNKSISEESSSPSIVNEICMEIKRRFSNKGSYYRFVLLILTPFLILDIWFLLIRSDRDAFLFDPSNRLQFAFEMYGKLIAYFIEYLIALMLWIIIHIYKAFKIVGNRKFRSYVQIDLFSIDGIGGLGHARDSTKKIVLYYFGSMTLAILTFSISLSSVFYDLDKKFFFETKYALEFSYLMQIILYIILLIVGLYYSTNMYLEIRKIFNEFILEECCINSKIYNEKRNKLRKEFSEINMKKSDGEINRLRTDLEIINADRENLMRSAKSGFNLSIILTIACSFLSSLIIPILTMINLIQGIMKGP